MSPARDLAGAFNVEGERAAAVAQGAQADLLHVQQEFGRVFLHASDGRELVLDLVDAHGGHGGAFERAEEHAAQRVAERDAVARFERLGDEPRVALGFFVDGELGDDFFGRLSDQLEGIHHAGGASTWCVRSS